MNPYLERSATALFLSAVALALSFDSFATELQPSLVDNFDSTQSENVSVDGSTGVTLTLVENALLRSGTAIDYRGAINFATQDNNGPYWIEKSKDAGADLEGGVNECLEQQYLDDLAGPGHLDTLAGEVYATDNGQHFRIGPEPAATNPISTAVSGDSLIPQGWGVADRMSGLHFLTTGTHVYSGSPVAEQYAVTLGYDSGPVTVDVRIPLDSSNFSNLADSSSGDATCDASDTWCVRPHADTASDTRVGTANCSCDGNGLDSDQCWILEVFVPVDDAQQINDVSMTWTEYKEDGSVPAGLEGPFAVTYDIDEPSYDSLFTYDGEYVTQQIDAGARAVWYGIGWDQSSSSGPMRVRFECGDGTVDVTSSTNDWGEDNADPYPFESSQATPSFPIQSATATSGDSSLYDNHCVGRYAEVSVRLLDPFTPGMAATDPRLDSISLSMALDADGDGYDAEGAVGLQDCDDSNPNIHPGATDDPGDDVDENCSGTVVCYEDGDADGFGTTTYGESSFTATGGQADVVGACASDDTDLWDEQNTDCNDSNSAAYPGALEICDGTDNNCDGQIDEGVKSTWYHDGDSDGYGDSTDTTQACTAPGGYVNNSTDCNDGNSSINPGATDVLGNDLDENCSATLACYDDGDSDGFGAFSGGESSFTASGGLADLVGACGSDDADAWDDTATDCNDGDGSVNPDATETCDGADNDCDGLVDDDDDDVAGQSTWYLDADSDAYGSAADPQDACTAPSDHVSNSTDCNDSDASINPGATDVPGDDVDQNCDATVACYPDGDGDGFGSLPGAESTFAASGGSAELTGACGSDDADAWDDTSNDCDDARSAIHPDAAEVCDNVDNDCDTLVDEDDEELAAGACVVIFEDAFESLVF